MFTLSFEMSINGYLFTVSCRKRKRYLMNFEIAFSPIKKAIYNFVGFTVSKALCPNATLAFGKMIASPSVRT